jgi:hypothetical protein
VSTRFAQQTDDKSESDDESESDDGSGEGAQKKKRTSSTPYNASVTQASNRRRKHHNTALPYFKNRDLGQHQKQVLPSTFSNVCVGWLLTQTQDMDGISVTSDAGEYDLDDDAEALAAHTRCQAIADISDNRLVINTATLVTLLRALRDGSLRVPIEQLMTQVKNRLGAASQAWARLKPEFEKIVETERLDQLVRKAGLSGTPTPVETKQLVLADESHTVTVQWFKIGVYNILAHVKEPGTTPIQRSLTSDKAVFVFSVTENDDEAQAWVQTKFAAKLEHYTGSKPVPDADINLTSILTKWHDRDQTPDVLEFVQRMTDIAAGRRISNGRFQGVRKMTRVAPAPTRSSCATGKRCRPMSSWSRSSVRQT